MVAVVGVLLALALVGPVSAQVDCSNPDNLCTGDPCVIPALEVGPNCVVDFGARAVVIAGTVRVTDLLDLSALSFVVDGRILGGVTVQLTATAAVDVRKTIKTGGITLEAGPAILTVAGRLRAESVTLRSGGGVSILKPVRGRFTGIDVEAVDDIDVLAPLVASTTMGSGDVTLEAGGVITMMRSIYTDSRYPFGSGGYAVIRGDSGVVVGPGVLFSARHSQLAGGVVVESSAGDVSFDARVHASAAQDGGSLDIDGQNVTAHLAMVANGGYMAGRLDVQATGDLVLDGNVSVQTDAVPGGGGRVRGVAGGNVTVSGSYRAAPNGTFCFSAGGAVDTSGATFDGPVTSCPP
jgi:hypothetical protein